MKKVSRIGLDIAKNYFQVHGVDKRGKEVLNRKLRRDQVIMFFANLPACLVGIEACAGAYNWAREIEGLDAGHTVRLVSPRHVKPFVVNNKTDAADAKAICEVAGRPDTRFVAVKTVAQQDLAAWHRIRERKIRERTALANQIRGLLGELGIVIAQGINHVRNELHSIIENMNNKLSMMARDYMSELYTELLECDEAIKRHESRIFAYAKSDEACRRIQKIPGIGPITATAIVAHFGQAKHFKNGRAFAACLGLTPREHSSGGKQKLLGITKRGNSYIRYLLIQGARVALRYALLRPAADSSSRLNWIRGLCSRKNKHIAAVALANKTARIIWALLSSGEAYQPCFAQTG